MFYKSVMNGHSQGHNNNSHGWKEIKRMQNEMEKKYEEMVELKGIVED